MHLLFWVPRFSFWLHVNGKPVVCTHTVYSHHCFSMAAWSGEAMSGKYTLYMYKHLVPVIYLITNHPLHSQETRPPSPKRPPSPPVPKARPLVSQSATPTGPIEIRRDYNPKTHGPSKPVTEKAPTEGQFLISPITGEKIPAHKMQEHMRYSERPISVYRIQYY